MKLKSKAALLCLLVVFVLFATACEKEGTAEKAGKKIDEAVSSAKEKIDEATNK